jgi:CubicO group peptidase (beta-lactamase class C family)
VVFHCKEVLQRTDVTAGANRPFCPLRRRAARYAAAAITALALATGASPVVTPAHAQSRSFDAAAFERAVREEMRATHTPGVAAAVVSGDSVVYAKGFGVTSVEGGQPVTPETLFRIGSTTKMFTGLAAVLLGEEGRLDLGRPVGGTVPGLHPAIARLTLHQLLSHTAAVINEASGDGPHDDAALGARVRGWGPEHLFGEPGDVYSYSSPGYWLAGHVIEVAGGKPYADVLAERIFAPLGMRRTTFRPMTAMTYPLALDHRVGAGGRAAVLRPFPDDASTWPGGSMFSSARDLARFAVAFLNGGRVDGRQLIPAAAIATLSTRQAATPDSSCGYTYGLAACVRRGVRTLSHYGFRGGSGSVVAMAPDQRFAVIILANRNGGIFARSADLAMEQMLPFGRDVASADSTPPRPAASGDRARLAGTYVNGPDTLRLAARGEGLVYRYGGEESEARVGSGDRVIVVDGAGAAVQEFQLVTGRTGQAIYLYDGLNAFRKVGP